MKKKLLLVIVLFASVLLISGCTNNGERRIKINKISFNEPVNFIEMKMSEGEKSNTSDFDWISYRYGFDGYTIRVICRKGQTFDNYKKTSSFKFKDKKVNDIKTHYYEDDEYSYTVFEYKKDLYIIEYVGNKGNNKYYKDLVNSIK